MQTLSQKPQRPKNNDRSGRQQMPETRYVPGPLPVTLLRACLGDQHPANIGLTESQPAPCPASPHFESSQASTETRRGVALRYNGDRMQAQARPVRELKDMVRVTVIRADASHVHVKFRWALSGFVDNVEFHLDQPGAIQVRSASRVCYSDFAVNRARGAAIRECFVALAGAPS